jgi:hypothetical protein
MRRPGLRTIGVAAGAVAAAIAAPAGATEQRQLLQSFAAPPYAYELALEGCASTSGDPPAAAPSRPSACKFVVGLLDGGKVLDRAALPKPGCGPGPPTQVSLTLGADGDAKAWTSDDTCTADVAARTVKLGANAAALLVTELFGSEYRFRSHVLYLPRAGKLQRAWHYEDDTLGAHWTRTAVIAGPSGIEDVAFVEVARSLTGVTSKITATRLHLDAASGRIVRRPLPDAASSLFLLQFGQFKRPDDAQGRPECLHELVVMRASLFPRLALPAFFLGALFARRDEADATLAALSTCAQALPGKIFDIAPKRRTHAEQL